MMWKTAFLLFSALFAVGLTVLVGGFRDIDINDEGVQNALNFAVVQHNKATNDMFLHQPIQVVKAQSQVVAGMKYVITVKMAKTSCRKESTTDNCEVHTDPEKAQSYQCTFTVWSRPWLNNIQLLDQRC